MRIRKVSDCPVGATWEAKTKDEWEYKVYLKERDGIYETWIVEIWNGYRYVENDWYPSKSTAFKVAREWMNKDDKSRFKRTI